MAATPNSPVSTGVRTILSLLATGLLLSACSGGESTVEPDARGSDAPPASPTETEPATGPVLRTPATRVHAPDDWYRSAAILEDSAAAEARTGVSTMLIYDTEQFAPHTLDQLVRATRRQGSWESDAVRLDDVMLDGLSGYGLRGREAGVVNWEWGTQAYERDVTLLLSLDVEIPAREREDIAASVLASFEWTVD